MTSALIRGSGFDGYGDSGVSTNWLRQGPGLKRRDLTRDKLERTRRQPPPRTHLLIQAFGVQDDPFCFDERDHEGHGIDR